MRNRSLAVVCSLVVIALCDPAIAQSTDHWIRSGTFPSRDAALARGIQVQGSIAVDVDRDGLGDELLTLSSSEDEGQALVLARRDAAGWRLACVACDAIGGIDDWRQAVTLPTGVVAVRAHDGQGDGVNNVHEIFLYWIAPRAEPVEALYLEDGNSFQTLSALPDGSLLLTRASGSRYQLLSWNAAHTRLTAGRPTRQPPALASSAPAGGPASGTPTSVNAECTAQPHASFHLRPTETLASEGPELPAGTTLRVLAQGSLLRGATRIFRVQVAAGGAGGFVFLAPGELSAGCHF